MSVQFAVGGEVLWSAANRIAQLFIGQAEAVASTFQIASGLSEIIEDECAIDALEFDLFVTEVESMYERATHPILRSLLVGIIPTALVLLERAGEPLSDGAPQHAGDWAVLTRLHEHSMPRTG